VITAEAIQRRALELEARCKAAGHSVTLGGDVRSEVAAELIGIAETTLRNRRSAGQRGPKFSIRNRTVWYALTRIAEYLLETESSAAD
jgi:hypothetical protein